MLSNYYQKKKCFVNFVVLSGPSPPRNLTAKSINSSAILVSWVTPVNLNGKIKYRLSFNKRSELVYDGNGTRYLVSNLKPYTQYTFSLVAYNIKYNLTSAAVHTLESTPQDGKFFLKWKGWGGGGGVIISCSFYPASWPFLSNLVLSSLCRFFCKIQQNVACFSISLSSRHLLPVLPSPNSPSLFSRADPALVSPAPLFRWALYVWRCAHK